MNNKIISSLDTPEELEELYHLKKSRFKAWLEEAIKEAPESETLRVWNARINYSPPISRTLDIKGLALVIVLSLLSFLLVKIPSLAPVANEWFYPRFVPIIMISTLMIYFSYCNSNSLLQRLFVFGTVLLSVIFMIILPDNRSSATIIMAQIHLPLFLLSFLAITFMSSDWKNSESRLTFVRYLGEIIIYGTIILLGGMILTGITIGLFSLIDISVEKWYGEYIVVLGLVAAPVVATFLYDNVLKRSSNIAAIIANTFSPLFLITVICYLVAMFFAQKSPFSDRDFLIIFNGLLLTVWGITVFSIAGKNKHQESKIVSIVNIALIATTLIINTIALSAILFRLMEYGITPNKVVVTGSNILIFIHLLLILVAYLREMKTSHPPRLLNAIASFLPFYTCWSLFVILVLPFIFRFK